MSHSAESLFIRFQQTGKTQLLGLVYDETVEQLWPLALQLTRDPNLAEDLLQNTFLVAMERYREWKVAIPLLDWLTTLLAQCHLDRDLDRQTLAFSDEALGEPANEDGPISQALARELDEQLNRALEQLPPHYREVLELRIREGKDSAAIGAQLGKSAGTVRSQIARGLERLRMLLPVSTAVALAWMERAEGGQGLNPSAGAAPKPWLPEVSLLPEANASPMAWWAWAAGLLLPVLLLGAWWAQQPDSPSGSDRPALASWEPPTDGTLLRAPSHPQSSVRTASPQAQVLRAQAVDERARVHGRIVDETGQPVPNATVTLFAWRPWRPDFQAPKISPQQSRRGWQQVTGADGAFAFAVPSPRETEPVLEVEAGDWMTQEYLWLGGSHSGRPALKAGENALGDIRLEHGGVLEAQLLDAEGEPVAMAQISFWPGQNYHTGSMLNSDPQGFVRIANLEPGWHHITVSKEHFAVFLTPHLVQPRETTAPQVWRLPRSVPTPVQVVDAFGEPLPKARLTVIYPGSFGVRIPVQEPADAHGQVELQLPLGEEVWIEARHGAAFPTRTKIAVRAEPEKVVLTLPTLPSFELTVVDASGAVRWQVR